MFHLGWFIGDSTGIHKWNGTWASSNGKDWTKPDIYIDLATSLERGGFDLMFIEDTAMVEDTYGGTMEMSLKYGEMVRKKSGVVLVMLAWGRCAMGSGTRPAT